MKKIFFNINSGHFKVWGFENPLYNNNGSYCLKTYRGMIGKPLNQLRPIIKEFKSKSEAEKYITKKVREKVDYKKYVTMPAVNYFSMIKSKKPLSSIISILEEYMNSQN